MGSYLDCLEQELSAVMQEFRNEGITVDTIYIGGGTPTVLNHADLKRMLSIVRDQVSAQFNVSPQLNAGSRINVDSRPNVNSKSNIMEYTVEAGRPDSLDMQKLQLLKEYGITRLSINPQSMNQETLDLVGRSHTVEDIVNMYTQARGIGFDCINMDVILGLPGETAEHMYRTMKGIADLKPDNVTIHTLAVKRASALKESFHQYDPSRRGLAEEMADVCREWIEKMNMTPYYLYRQKYMLDHLENVGYSVPGKECLYNIHIMEEKRSIWAFGAGAASKIYYSAEDRLERIANVKNLDEYIGRIGEMIEKKRKVLRK
jgi:oxygen-independent coproporphyrinogen-3 oxidase